MQFGSGSVGVLWLSLAACSGNLALGGPQAGDAGGSNDGMIAVGHDSGFSDAGGISSSVGAGDAATMPLAAPPFDAGHAPPGLAGIAFVVNGDVQTPLGCPAANWEFAPTAAQVAQSQPSDAATSTSNTCSAVPCPGLTSVLLVNTGSSPVAYTAQSSWMAGSASEYPPGVNLGEPQEMTGVLSPGDQVDIISVYQGGITAVLGSAAPFSQPDAGYAADESTISWPAGVPGSGGATQMYVAQIDVVDSCSAHPTIVW